ncbi:hypothetical protein LPJ56_005655 [Coemansia sp. RSA 2599]|nr:hypothetical protein LPJ75_005637 [Coemansia sp. RSA 2598]KAJ1811934.1 hypothetical protein LPJ56_005655 [Coemansia sp. RSA 2599]
MTDAVYAVFVVLVVVFIIAGSFARRRNAIRRLREQEQREQELQQQQQAVVVDLEGTGRTFYTTTAPGVILLYPPGVRSPAVAHFAAQQPEENKPDYLPPYQPPSKPLADPPAYSEAAAGPSTPATPERAAHA